MATKVGVHRGEVKVARPNSDNMTFEVRYIFVRGSHGLRNPHLNDGGANFRTICGLREVVSAQWRFINSHAGIYAFHL